MFKCKKCGSTIEINGETSDGYHTFNELYHHRAVLFSVICNQNKEIAWKSKKHSDGTMFDNMFIIGINTPYGQATYHYDINPYWDYFKVKELSNAPVWDGHTPQQAIDRILKLSTEQPDLTTEQKLMWLVENFDVTIVKDYTLCVLDRKEYARHRIVLNLNKVIESDISQKEAINVAYDWAKEEL